MKYLWGYLKNCRRAITVGTIIKVIGTMMDLLIPYILAHILNNVVERKEVEPLVFWGCVMVLCAILK